MTQAVISITGLQAVGKTYFSKKLLEVFPDLNYVSGDDLKDYLISNIKHFHEANYSCKDEKMWCISRLAFEWKKELLHELLVRGESILHDGAGAKREKRMEYNRVIDDTGLDITTVMICVKDSEEAILRRLDERDQTKGHMWREMYENVWKNRFEEPKDDEADHVIVYNKSNKIEIINSLRDIL